MHRSPSAIRAALVVAPEPYAGEGPQWVVAQAEEELAVRYGSLHHGELGLTATMFDPPGGVFLVARRAGTAGPPLGGVGLRVVGPAVGEVRRLWVDPGQRGQGTGRRLMSALEDAGRELDLTSLRLATGERQPEAIALYESTGWERVRVDDALCGFHFTKDLHPQS